MDEMNMDEMNQSNNQNSSQNENQSNDQNNNQNDKQVSRHTNPEVSPNKGKVPSWIFAAAAALVIVIGIVIVLVLPQLGKEDPDNDKEVQTTLTPELTQGTQGSTGTEGEGTQTDSLETIFSAGLNEDGTISGISIKDYVTLCDYEGIKLSKSAMEVTEAALETELNTWLSQFEDTLNTSPELTVQNGDTIFADFVGTMDGVEFSGGSTNGAGTDITIGAGGLIDDFEEQLIGAKPGDTVTVEVTFPEEYQNNPAYSGKDAVFTVEVHGIYQAPVLDDAFVAENLSQYAADLAGFQQYVKDYLYQANVEAAVSSHLIEGSSVSSFPESYYEAVKASIDYNYVYRYNYYNYMYYNYIGSYPWATVYDFYEMTEAEYNEMISMSADSNTKYMMVNQAVFEALGKTITDADILNCVIGWGYTEADYDSLVGLYGEPFWRQQAITDIVIDYMVEKAIIE